jgi:hypothetical protein
MPDHEQADAVVGRVAQKIERIGLQRRRPGGEARADLNHEHRRVDGKHCPERTLVGGALFRVAEVQRRRRAAAISHTLT